MTSKEKIGRDVTAYLKANPATLYALTYDGLTFRQSCTQKSGVKGNTKTNVDVTNVIVFSREWIDNNFSVFLGLFAWHEGQTKTARIVIDKAITIITRGKSRNLDNVDGVTLETFDIPYSAIAIGANGTRSENLEKMLCARLGFEWCGNEQKSAFFEYDTGKRIRDENRAYTDENGELIIPRNKWRKVVPDGKTTDLDGAEKCLECKCLSGRFTVHSAK